MVCQFGQPFDAALIVLERPVEVQQLAGIDDMQTLPAGFGFSAVEPLDQIDRFGNVELRHTRNLKPQACREPMMKYSFATEWA